MSTKQLEARVAALEAEIAKIKARLVPSDQPDTPWWKEIIGTFEGDPYYEEAMRLGREYRESLRPKPRKKKKSNQ